MNSNKVILITGASRGLGRAAAAHLAQLQCNIALCARAPQLTEAPWFDSLPESKRLYSSVDLRDPIAIQQFAAQVQRKFGRLDVLINNASIFGVSGRLADIPLNEWLSALNTNVVGSLAMVQACAPMLRTAHGCVIQVISSAGLIPIAHCAPYCVTKAAQIMMMRTLDTEEPDITTICYDPGMMDTDMQNNIRTEVVPNLPLPYQSLFTEAYKNDLVSDIESAGRTLAWQALHPIPKRKENYIDGSASQTRLLAQQWWKSVAT